MELFKIEERSVMKNIMSFYLGRFLESIVDNIWRGIWTAIGFIIVTKATGVFVILTS
jgi:hypothetical protein